MASVQDEKTTRVEGLRLMHCLLVAKSAGRDFESAIDDYNEQKPDKQITHDEAAASLATARSKVTLYKSSHLIVRPGKFPKRVEVMNGENWTTVSTDSAFPILPGEPQSAAPTSDRKAIGQAVLDLLG